MQPQKEQYLQSLLNWASEVQEKIKQTHMSEEDEVAWNKKMNAWKEKIEGTIKQDKEISEKDIQSLQAEGKDLIYHLADYYDDEREGFVPIGKHKLPPLPYDYDALEPYISKEIMKLHHDVHHKSYVNGLNEAELKLAQMRKSGDSKLIKYWLREQAFNGSGHFLHTIFWGNMTPDGEGKPKGDLLTRIEKDFGSLKAFKQQFSDAAQSVEGVGWAILLWGPRSGRLAIQTTEKHQHFALWDSIPLLVLDVWEHAYYLQYQNKRDSYIENWWNVVHWENVSERFEQARQLRWSSF